MLVPARAWGVGIGAVVPTFPMFVINKGKQQLRLSARLRGDLRWPMEYLQESGAYVLHSLVNHKHPILEACERRQKDPDVAGIFAYQCR